MALASRILHYPLLLLLSSSMHPACAAASTAQLELGRHLFFDRRLSSDLGSSCASCHQPQAGWADGSALALSYGGIAYAGTPASGKHFRNTPSLLDIAQRTHFGHDGRYSDLASAISAMISGPQFLGADNELVLARLRQTPAYPVMWEKAFGKSAPINTAGMTGALAAFVQTLRSGPSRVDRFVQGETDALSAQEKEGLALFRGKAKCHTCHTGAATSDGQFHRLGVPEHPDISRDPLRMVALLSDYASLRLPNVMSVRADAGRFAITGKQEDWGNFRTPDLRSLKATAPYMHNGVFDTLEAVLDFYNRGGGAGGELQALGLSDAELQALAAVLRAMSGASAMVEMPAEPAFALLPNKAHKPVGRLDEQSGARVTVPLAPLSPPPIPADNPMSDAKIALGKQLFWDGRLSGNGQMGCVACHLPALGGGDGQAISRAYPGTRNWRNALPTLNAAYYQRLFWDGRAQSLEKQASMAATSPVEGNGDLGTMEMRLRMVPSYVQQFKQVFGTPWPRIDDAWRAIAAYERSLVSDPAKVPFDRYLNGDRQALDASAQRGYALFSGKAKCVACHNGPFLTDQRYYALGVPSPEAFKTDPLQQVTVSWQQRDEKGAPRPGDHGRFRVTSASRDWDKFRTPTLRELKTSGPYMHNGAFARLIDVVQFFNRGGAAAKPLGLSPSEEADLVAFLESLSMDQPPVEADPVLPPSTPLK